MLVRDVINNKNVRLQVDGSNQLSVKDGALSTLQTTANADLSSIKTAVEGTLAVSSPVTRSSGTLSSAAVVLADDKTSSVDCDTKKKVAVYGQSSSNTQEIRILVSDDDVTYYQNQSGSFYANASNGEFYNEFECVARYFKLAYAEGATMTTKYSLRS
tara:strand:- start:756 stop:1229 length:474 start_codon:yes stop_codon:yes gene_type:complete